MNNLPGATYLFWLLGKAAGWGNTRAFYSFDASLVVGFVALLIFWSIRRLGSALPGLVGSLVFLAYYLNLSYSLAGQRDWHASAFALGGLLLSQIFRGRLGLIASAIGAALALVTRPQTVVFLPAFLAQIMFDVPQVEPATQAGSGRGGRALTWLVVFGIALAACFGPIVAQGLLGDMVRQLRNVAPGSSYNKRTLRNGT